MSTLPADLLQRAGRRNALPWLIAAAAFLMTLAMAGTLALGRSASTIEADAVGRITISIAEADPARREAAAARAMTLLSSGSLVSHVERVDQAEVARLVSPYLGAQGDIPLPALIDAELRQGSTPRTVRAALRPISAARVDDEVDALAPLLGLITALRRVALTVLLVAALVAVLVTVLVGRAALASHAVTIETLHGLGATDTQLARLIGRRSALDTLAGATFGLVAAIGTIVLVGGQLGALNGGNPVGLPVTGWIILCALPLILTGAGMLATRLTILRQLRRAV